MPRVSIVIPVFNAGRTLPQALASVAAQTERDFEVVVVDDGSTDPHTLAVLANAGRHPGVTVLRTPNRGPAAARNLAIERSAGAYVLPLDADDVLAPAFLARTIPVLDTRPEIGVVHTWVGLRGGHHGVWRTGDFTVRALLSRCTIHVSSLYRRALWADVGGYDPAFVETAEDWDFWLGAATRGWQGAVVPEVLVYYRRAAGGRERLASAAGADARVMSRLVAKHRALYAAHLDDALVGFYEQSRALGRALERVYGSAPARALLWLRARLRGEASS